MFTASAERAAQIRTCQANTPAGLPRTELILSLTAGVVGCRDGGDADVSTSTPSPGAEVNRRSPVTSATPRRRATRTYSASAMVTLWRMLHASRSSGDVSTRRTLSASS